MPAVYDNERIMYQGGPDCKGSFTGEFPHTISILPVVKAHTPHYIGAEVEYQDYADEVNIWDFVKDAGIQMTRSRSFDVRSRDQNYSWERYVSGLTSRQAFEDWKLNFLKTPERYIEPGSYDFSLQLPDEGGIPDKSVEHILSTGAVPCIQLKYCQSQNRQILSAWHLTDRFPEDEKINWPVFADAYLHYFTVMRHFTEKFGCYYYMLDNEPYPEPGKPYFLPDCPCPDPSNPEENKMTHFYAVLGVLSCAARMAMEDLKAVLQDRQLAARLFLSGFAVFLRPEAAGKTCGAYLDAVDCHHYGRTPENFDRRFRGLQKIFPDKKIFCSEFNVRGGPVHPDHSFFCVRPCLEFADLMMHVLSVSDPGGPGLESAMLYQFSYPATHRTFKSLVYGDMNVADLFSVWGREKMIIRRPRECHPTMEESQMRFQTMAYQIYRMLSRCVPGARRERGNEVLEIFDGFFTSDRSLLVDQIKTMAVRSKEALYISILNPAPEPMQVPLHVDLSHLDTGYRFAILRTTARMSDGYWLDDRVIRVEEIKDNTVDICPLLGESFNQLILTNEPLDRIERLELREETVTPGSIRDNLRLYQTTLLTPWAVADGKKICLKDLNVVWESSEPDLVCVYQSGLVQRVRDTEKTVTVKASVSEHPELSVSIAFPGTLTD